MDAVEFKVERSVTISDGETLLIGPNPFGRKPPRQLEGSAVKIDGKIRSILRGSLTASIDLDGGMYSLFQHNKLAIVLEPLASEDVLVAISADYVTGLERALSEYVVLGAGKCTISKAHADMGRAALAAKP